jgi:hypothetical protein
MIGVNDDAYQQARWRLRAAEAVGPMRATRRPRWGAVRLELTRQKSRECYGAKIIATKSISKIGINTMAKIRAMPPPISYDFSSSASGSRGRSIEVTGLSFVDQFHDNDRAHPRHWSMQPAGRARISHGNALFCNETRRATPPHLSCGRPKSDDSRVRDERGLPLDRVNLPEMGTDLGIGAVGR